MHPWHKYIAQIVSMLHRGKLIEREIKPAQLDLTPSQLLNRIKRAQEVQMLYQQAQRMCSLLSDKIDTQNICQHIQTANTRIEQIVVDLNARAKVWNIEEPELNT